MRGAAEHILETALAGLEWTDRGGSLDDFLDRADAECRRSAGFVLFAFFRHKKAIDRLLAGFIRKTPDRKIMHLLEIAATQVFFCRGIAGNSAVNVAVGWCRAQISRSAAGFVNAVLHKITPLPPPEDVSPEAVLPDPVLHRWRAQFSPEEIAGFARTFLTQPETTFRCTAGEPPDAEELAALDAETVPTPFPDCPFPFYRTRDPGKLLASPSWQTGRWYIQDPAAAMAVSLADFRHVRRALDVCAAPGGKSLMIAEKLPPGGLLVAADRSEARQKRTRENFLCRNWDFPTPAATPEELPEHWRDFDLVLADVPCSNTGVFRGRPDALWHFRADTVAELADLQTHLVLAAADRVAPGGQLLYSTCSIDREENEERCAAFLRERSDFRDGGEKRLLPCPEHDGAYAHRMIKVR